MAIAKGIIPNVNGICRNLYWTELQDEVMMSDPKYLNLPTNFSEKSKNGRKVTAVIFIHHNNANEYASN